MEKKNTVHDRERTTHTNKILQRTVYFNGKNV